MLLYFIRHGDPIYDPDSLTELGKKQSVALANRLALYGFDRIYCSTSERAKQTAAPICEMLNKTPIYLDWTNEYYVWRDFTVISDVGGTVVRNWIFHNEEYIDKLNSVEVRNLGFEWYKHEYFKEHDFEKGINRINEETDKFISSLGYRHDRKVCGYIAEDPSEKRIALFAHQGFGLAFLSGLMDIPYPYFSTHFDFGHSSVTVICFDKSNATYKTGKRFIYPKILQLSNDSHLYKEDILTGYQNFIDL